MNDQDKIIFPCDRIPEASAIAKLLGLVRQRQDDLWMQRVKIPGGVLTAEQWRAVGRIALEFTPGAPLHLTTRQDIELHDLTCKQVPLVQAMLAEAGLTCLGAGGDSLRNVTVCPCSGILNGAVDLHPLAHQLRLAIEDEAGILSLPRKFKISLLSCSRACGAPWINDLGFVVRRKAGQYGFRVIGAGSLGSRPRTGMVLFDWLAVEEVLPAAIAAVRVFAAHGDREHRNLARFRHIRDRLGDKKFMALMVNEFETTRSQRVWPSAALTELENGFAAHLILTFPNGDLSPEAAEALACLAAIEDICIRISCHHKVIVLGSTDQQLREALSAFDPLGVPAEPQATIVACPGTRWCKRALVDTNRIARRIGVELGGKLAPQITVCVSGCPNGCAHSAVADIGLIGQLVSVDGRKTEAFDLLAKGGMGRNDKLAQCIASKLSADEVLAKIGGICSDMNHG
ncbi:MAG: nitrite/sulfite reductase [Planctomycetes bacterium]|nr:nitrite/sulfite reductase [Planctomycetota bacterium]